MTFLFYLMLFLFLGLCAILCLVILVQESKSMGLGATFGGESSDSLFGTSTAGILKKITGYLALVFTIACIVLSIWSSALGRGNETPQPTTIEQESSR
jgi:preprotein translocase subunit SecG